MSDVSQGPGWWIASDDKWYPPHLHPSVRVDPPTPENDGVVDPGHDTVETPAAAVSDTAAAADTGALAGPDPAGSQGEATSPGTAGFPPLATGPTTGSRRPLAAAVSVLVVVGLVAGAFVIFGGSKSAAAEVTAAVNSSIGDKTAQITTSERIVVKGTTLTGRGTGAFDFSHQAMDVHLVVTVQGQQVPIEAEYLGGIVYEKVPGLDQITPGKSWVSLDFSSLSQASSSDLSAQSAGANPSVMLRMAALQGNKVVALGPSTLDGVAVNGYAVTVSPSNILRQLKSADLPSWMRQGLVGFKTHGANLKVFVDGAGHLRSFEFQTTESSGAAGTVSIDQTLGFSHYGTPVSVTAPPADQVVGFEQFLQAAKAQTIPAS